MAEAEGRASALGQQGTPVSGLLLHGLCCSPELTCHLPRIYVSEKQDFLMGEQLRQEEEQEQQRNMNLEMDLPMGRKGLPAHPVPGTGCGVEGHQGRLGLRYLLF